MSSRLPLQLALSCVYCVMRVSFTWLADWLFPWCDHPSHCFDFNAELAASVDRRVDPCDNFYDHVCGSWNGSHGRTRNQFELLESRTRLLLLQELEKSPASSPFVAGAKMRAGYQNCLAVMGQQQENTGDLHDLFAEFHLDWPSLTWPHQEFDLLRFLVVLALRYDIHPLFKVLLVPYLLTDEGYSLALDDAGSRFWRATDIQSDCLRAFAGEANASAVAERITRVRTEVHSLESTGRLQYPYLPRYYKIQQLAEFTRHSVNVSKWLDVFNDVLNPDVQVGPEDPILVFSQRPLFLLWAVMSRYEYSMPDLLLYLGWKVLMDEGYAFSASLATCSRKPRFKESAVLSAEICVYTMLALAPAAMGHVLVGALGRAEAIKRSAMLAEHIRNASVRSFQNAAWMDADTSKASVERITSVVSVDGVPAHLLDRAAADKTYDFLPTFSEGTFGRQLLQARRLRFEKRRRLMYADSEKIKRRSEVPLHILSVNAVYMPVFHVMVVPAAIMQAPFALDMDVPAINFGSLGRVIGHELSHAFDVGASSIDEHAQPLTLYSAASRKELLARLACLIKQVNDGSGSNTLGNNSISEAFADNAGLEKAYLGFQALLQSGQQLSGGPASSLGYTAEQLFFVSGCFVFCAFQGYRVDQDAVYPPPFLRCNVPVMNTRNFGAAFSCAQGAPMNPIIRCNFH